MSPAAARPPRRRSALGLPLLAAAVLAVLGTGVVSALSLEAAASTATPSAAGPAASSTTAPAPVLAVVPAQQVAPAPVSLPAPQPAPAAPTAPEPAAAAPAPDSPAPSRTTAPAPVSDPLCSGPGWEQRRGEAALASLRRPSDAAGFRVTYAGAREGYIGLATVHERRLEVFVRTCDRLSGDLLRHVVAHELGHLVDGERMTDALRAQYLQVRGIPGDTPWYGCNGCADFATPAGDFAEVYAQWQRGATGNRSQLAPAPSPAELEQIAARFFG